MKNCSNKANSFTDMFPESGFLVHEDFEKVCEFRGSITQEDASKFLLWSQELITDKCKKPVYVLINCHGGDVHAVLSIHHHLTVLRQFLTVKTWNINEAYSGAALILASGTLGERYVSRHSHTMIHGLQVAMSHHAPIENWQTDMEQLQKLNNQFLWAVTKETLKGQYEEDLNEADPDDLLILTAHFEETKTQAKADTYLTATGAVKEGFADDVCSLILPFKKSENDEEHIPECHTYIAQQIVVTDPSSVSFIEEEEEEEEEDDENGSDSDD